MTTKLQPTWLEPDPEPVEEAGPARLEALAPANEPAPELGLRFHTRGTAWTDVAGGLWLLAAGALGALFAWTLL
jgi:hypothetical protein